MVNKAAQDAFDFYVEHVFHYCRMQEGIAYNETFMRDIEERCDVSEHMADDFRRGVAAYIEHMNAKGVCITWESNPQLRKAIAAYIGLPENSLQSSKYRRTDDPWEPAW